MARRREFGSRVNYVPVLDVLNAEKVIEPGLLGQTAVVIGSSSEIRTRRMRSEPRGP